MITIKKVCTACLVWIIVSAIFSLAAEFMAGDWTVGLFISTWSMLSVLLFSMFKWLSKRTFTIEITVNE